MSTILQLAGRALDVRDGDGERHAAWRPATRFTEDSYHHTAAQEAVTGCWRPEELSTSIQLDVHVEGCREDCRWATCRILAVKRSDAAVAVRLPATPFNGDGVTTGFVGHFLRCWPPARHIARSTWPERCVPLHRPRHSYSSSAAVVRIWRHSVSVDPVVSMWPHPAGFLRRRFFSHHTTCFWCATRLCSWPATFSTVHCWAFRHHRAGRTDRSLLRWRHTTRPLRARTHQVQFRRNGENRKRNFSWSLKIG